MTAEASTELTAELPQQKRFPKKMIAMTALVGAFILVSKFFPGELADSIGLAPDFANVAGILLILLLLLGWGIWTILFSKLGLLTRLFIGLLLVSSPYLFVKIMRPVNGGDANIVRFNPVWTQPRVLDAITETPTCNVDLKTETPNDFPGFLGVSRDGDVSSQGGLPDNAVSNATIVWKKDVGEAWSGFAARNGSAVTMEQRGQDECTICYDIETGEVQWLYRHAARHRDMMNLGRLGPRSTPTIHGGMVYSMGAMGNLVCLNGSDGTPVWEQDLLKILDIDVVTSEDSNKVEYQYENSTLAWGRSGSPLIVDDMVIVPGGGPREGEIVTLLAFDNSTGELKWKSGTEMIAYGSPSLATLAGRRQILLVAETKAMGFDAETGDVLWDHTRLGSSEGDANTSQVTVVSENQVLLSKGYNKGGELIELQSSGEGFTTKSLVANPRVLKTKLTSPVFRQGYTYSLSDGFLECADTKTLERKWKKRGRYGHGQLLLCGDKLIVHSESGNLSLVRAIPDKFEELGSLKTIDGVCWNTLCRYGDLLLVRSELEAACIRLGK